MPMPSHKLKITGPIVLMVGFLLTACQDPTRRAAPPGAYFGPTETMYEVAEAVNANNRLLPTLSARQLFEATVVDPETGRAHYVNGEGDLHYRRPHELRLVGTKPIIGRVFDIGSDPDRFWLTIHPELQTMWWGHYRNLGRPCAQEIPIRPDLILEVLGISEIDPDFTRPPAPTMRFNNDADAYMFVWNVPGPDRWIAQKEIWYDRRTKWPRMVLLFDDHGRVVLRAYLFGHQPVEVPDLPREQWPVVATDFRLFFPETGTRMRLELEEPALRRGRHPADLSFAFRVPQDVQVIQIDADCNP